MHPQEPALFQPDNKYRCIGAGITGIQLKIKVAVLCAFRLYALQFFLRQLKLGHVLQAGGCGVHTQQACQLGLRDITAKAPVRQQKARQRVAAGDGRADIFVQLPDIV